MDDFTIAAVTVFGGQGFIFVEPVLYSAAVAGTL